jgi:transcriptional regulator with XRE-family HTH domain
MGAIAARFAQNLARTRRRKGLSQEALSVRASVHRTEISQLERGLRVPRIDTMVKLAAGLGVTPDVLLEGIEWTPGRRSTAALRFSPRTTPSRRPELPRGRRPAVEEAGLEGPA